QSLKHNTVNLTTRYNSLRPLYLPINRNLHSSDQLPHVNLHFRLSASTVAVSVVRELPINCVFMTLSSRKLLRTMRKVHLRHWSTEWDCRRNFRSGCDFENRIQARDFQHLHYKFRNIDEPELNSL